jgi:hypothetical protein
MLDPMSQPYTPGARTTLADARLQLVCALLPSADSINSAIESADTTLKAMEARHG